MSGMVTASQACPYMEDIAKRYCGISGEIACCWRLPRPDAIFITNDFFAAVVMQVLKDSGIYIPGDIAIVALK